MHFQLPKPLHGWRYAEAASLSARLQIITKDLLVNENLGQAPKQLEDEPPSVTAAVRQFCTPILEQPNSRKI
jgi:hypothetical protein